MSRVLDDEEIEQPQREDSEIAEQLNLILKAYRNALRGIFWHTHRVLERVVAESR
jgi:hypothetical protein